MAAETDTKTETEIGMGVVEETMTTVRESDNTMVISTTIERSAAISKKHLLRIDHSTYISRLCITECDQHGMLVGITPLPVLYFCDFQIKLHNQSSGKAHGTTFRFTRIKVKDVLLPSGR